MAKSNKVNTINTTRVLKTIWQQGQISRVDLARLLDLDKSSITKIVTNLMEKNLIVILEEGSASPQGGRKPVYLGLNKDFGLILGVELQTREYHINGLNLYGDILFQGSGRLDISNHTLDQAFFTILENHQQEIDQTGLPLVGAGIGLSGIIDTHNGIICQSYPLDITNPYPLVSRIRKRLNIPILIENDANCGCYSELIQNRTQRISNFLYILSEYRPVKPGHQEIDNLSIGLGLVIQEQVLHGEGYSAGEFRSINWNNNSHSQFSINGTERDQIPAIIEELGQNVALLVNTLGLGKIIISGELGQYGNQVGESFHRSIEKNWPYPSTVDCEILINPLGEQAVAYGAAGVFLEQLFSLPDIEEEKGDTPKGILLFDAILD